MKNVFQKLFGRRKTSGGAAFWTATKVGSASLGAELIWGFGLIQFNFPKGHQELNYPQK